MLRPSSASQISIDVVTHVRGFRLCWAATLAMTVSLGILGPGGLTAAEPPVTKETKQSTVAPATPHPAPPLVLGKTTVVTKDLCYGDSKSADANFQSLDVYAPRGGQGLPVVIFVHGGGWTRGDRAEVGSQPKLFNDHGIVLVSIDYRLSPAHQHPAHVNDVAAAVAWTVKNIDRFGGDPQKIVLMGHSAGSHLAALAATDARPLASHKLKLSNLAGVISLDGSAFDIVDRVAKGTPKLAENCHRAFGTDEKGHRDASPLNHVEREAGIPPFLLLYVKDGSLNHAQSKTFGDKLQANGYKSELTHVSGKDHFSLAADLGTEGNSTDDQLLKFIQQVTRATIAK